MSGLRRSLAFPRRLAACLLALATGLMAQGAVEPAAGQPSAAQALFEQANDAYRRGAWAEAEAAWRSLLVDADQLSIGARDRARIALGLGNAAWRRERKPEALGWYTAAVRLDPHNADARANRDLVRAAAGLEPAEGGDLRSTLRQLLASWSPAERRWAVLGGLGLVLVLLVGEALRGGLAWRRAALVAALFLVLVSLPWMVGLARSPGGPRMLVVAEPSVALRSEPRESLDPTGKLRLGQEVERIDALPGWIRVRTASGERGWVAEGALFALER